ncbi:GNAT family N-acetyltransferase [Bacteroides mediterraneensis]|uniref:GNAT family N-acetyltransferase n=1 Tax=Bacteroides mediterraneensis TaxID=1841856 RepID=A0ABS2ERL0_9BACE|nr:GNAT family N-acetyltransferase [Bacteroides mediterraneensis]MBM6757191.1 GNAT family N-acetyltransferase [Bacteroides mediterraneensis]
MTIKEQVKVLWKQCFHDSDEFIDFYFQRRYTDDLNSYAEADGRVIAALQRIPYSLTYEGMEIPVAYISGACTDPAYRNKGVMRQLLAKAHRRMFREGVMFSTLIPAEEWLKGYYARSGYANCFSQGKKLLTDSSLPVDNFSKLLRIVEIVPGSTLCSDAFLFFNHFQSSQEAYIQHDWEDFHIILTDLRLSGGSLWGAFQGDILKGLCFCFPDGDALKVTELISAEEQVAWALVKFLLSHYQVAQAECLGQEGEIFYELGMARIIHVEAMLRLLAGTYRGNLYIKVEGDEAIPENNGWYNLEGGHYSSGKQEDKAYQVVSIEELTRLLFEGKYPYMNLMLN